MLRLKTFGLPLVERDGVPLEGAARQRRVLALLTLIASGQERGISRDRVLAVLWSESEPEKARQALTQALYHARRALRQDDLFIAAADLRVNPAAMTSDLGEFEDAIRRRDLPRAVAAYDGPFLDGFHVNGAPEFERWAAEQRARLGEACTRALEELAAAAEAAGDMETVVRWRKRLAALDPLNSRVALDLMRAMAAVGDRAGAIRYAHTHELLLREEMGASPNPAIIELARQLRETVTWTPTSPHPAVPDRPATAPHDERALPSNRVQLAEGVIEHDRGGLHAPAAEPTPTPVLPADGGRRKRPRWWRVGASVLALAVIALVVARLVADRRAAGAKRDLIVVAPFRVTGADPRLAYLHEGLVDLLVTSLAEGEATRVADPGAVMSAWRRAGLGDQSDVPRDATLAVARSLGGTRMLLGSVVGTPSRLVVSATLLGLPDGATRAQMSASGPADSLTTIVDRLVAQMLAKEAGEWERLARHTSTSAVALRAYLDGQAAYRRGRYRDAVRDFRRALERDASFAMAGLALANASERIDARDDRALGLAVAWAARSELTARDSVYLHALAGPRYPAESSPREYLAAWEHAAAAVPDRADVWLELGEVIFFDGRSLGLRESESRAAAAFRRAADLDPAFASPLQYLVQLAGAAGDTAAVRRAASVYLALDSVGELAPFVRWRSAIALRDDQRLHAVRRAISAMPAPSLRAIALSSQYNGIALDDAERALSVLGQRAVRGADRADALMARHALALNRGHPRAALELTAALAADGPRLSLALRRRVLDALYGDGDTVAAGAAAERLTSRVLRAAGPATAIPSRSQAGPEVADDACVVAQWQAWTTRIAQPPALDSRASDVSSPSAAPAATEQPCGVLTDAITAVRQGAPDAVDRLTRLDSLIEFAAEANAFREYGGLALARLYAAVGDNRRALDAARRRPSMQPWPHYLATQLREEGRLAAAAGDSSGAAAAYRHYLQLRSSPDAALRAEVADVREALGRLTGGG